MRRIESRGKPIFPLLTLLLTVLLLAPAGIALGRDVLAELPANAHAERYGDGWVCNRGYQDVDEACVAVKVPANAFLDSTGDDWAWVNTPDIPLVAGEWNTLEITARGSVLTLWANGAVTCEVKDCGNPKGLIGVEGEGFRIEFRNLKVKELR